MASQGTGPPFGGRSHLPAILALAVVAALVYANSFHAGFTLDNFYLISGDARIHDANIDNVRQILSQDYWAPQRFVTGTYRPLTTLSLLFNYAILRGGEDPVGYHVLNLLLHSANAVLVYFLALVVLADAGAAFLTAGLFAAHPIATEAVTNIVGRADLLATLAVLGGTLLYLRSRHVSGARRAACLLGLSLSTALGLLAKESAVGILGAMLAFDLAYPAASRPGAPDRARRPWGPLLAGYLALVPAFAGVALLRAGVYRNLEIKPTPFLENPLVGADPWTARLTAFKVLGKYVWRLVWPASLSCDYSYNAVPVVGWPPAGWEDGQALLALAGVIAALVMIIRWRRRSRPLVFFALFFLLTFLPVSNLVLPIGTLMGERLMYLPLVGFAGCVVVGVSTLCRRAGQAWPRPNALAHALLALVIVGYGIRAFVRNADWHDDLRLYESTVRAVPGSYKAHKGLAAALAAHDEAHAQLDRIIAEEEQALAIIGASSVPVEARSWTLLQQLGEAYGTKAGLVGVATPEGHRWLTRAADTLAQAAAVNQAKEDLRRAKAPADDSAPVGASGIYANLGDVYLALGDHEKAADAFRHLARLVPGDPAAQLGLARVQVARGELEQAAVSLIAALTLDGRRQDAWQLLGAVYERSDPGGCALVRTAGSAVINWSCPLVHEHLCAADAQLVRIFLDARQREVARQLVENAVQKGQCPREPLERLLAPTP